MPNLIEVQKRSYQWFLEDGLREIFQDISPIQDFTGNLVLEFGEYSLGEPKYTVSEVETDGKNPQHSGILRNFTNAILGTEPLFVDGKEGINGVEIMDAMLLSTWLGKAVDLPIDDDLYLKLLNEHIAASVKKEGVTETVLDTSGTYGSVKK